MKITLKRYCLPDYTIGKLSINGEYFCDTLEDPNRDLDKNGVFAKGEIKVYGKTCIPFGSYKVKLEHSDHFGRILPRIKEVPSFEGILIHRGNKVEDTLGCILVGENKVKGMVIHSTPYEKKIVELISNAEDTGENITIEIT